VDKDNTVVNFGDITGGTFQVLDGDFIYDGVNCNYPFTLSVRSKNAGLLNGEFDNGDGTGLRSGFATCYTHEVEAEFAPTSANVTLDSSCGGGPNIGTTPSEPGVGQLRVKLEVDGRQEPPIGGTFSDVITIQVGASL